MHDYSNTSSERTTSSSGTTWIKYGTLITKRIFVGSRKESRQRIVILTLIFVDQEGQQFELQSIDQEEKAYCVYRKVRYESTYKINGRGEFRLPNETYSTSKYMSKIRSWWLDELSSNSSNMSMKKYPYKSIDLSDAIDYYINKGKAVDIIGTFQGLAKGPDCRYINNKPSILGYYVILLDKSGSKFQVLVWHTPRVDKSNFEIFGAKKGDIILINACRSSFQPKERPIFTLTSLMQPVVNPPKNLYRL